MTGKCHWWCFVSILQNANFISILSPTLPPCPVLLTANAKCIWALPDVVPSRNQTRHEINIEKQKNFTRLVGKFCMQSRWCIGQFCIEHITCRPNLTKFSQKRSIRWKCILQACCLFSDTKLLTLLVTTFCSYLSSLLSVWNNLFNQFECLGKQHWTWYWEMPFQKIFLSQSRKYYLSI